MFVDRNGNMTKSRTQLIVEVKGRSIVEVEILILPKFWPD